MTQAVRWWPHTEDPRVASYRLRCLRIVDELKRRGVDAGIYRRDDAPPAVLVLSKRYDARTMEQAVDLRDKARTRIVLDLCDNHFHMEDATPALLQRAESLKHAVAKADHITVASEALAEELSVHCPAHAALTVVPDAVELPVSPQGIQRLRHWRAEWSLARLARWLDATGVGRDRRLLWFGNHGSNGVQGGMSDLLRLRRQLEDANRRRPVSLTVISNDFEKFARLTEGWQLPVFYQEWSAHTFTRAAELHGASIIPIGVNPFTRCKTNNRLATSLLHGLNVIADGIPSYREFAACAVLDDWARGLGPYLDDHERRHQDVLDGRHLVLARYSLDLVAEQWRRTLSPLVHPGGMS